MKASAPASVVAADPHAETDAPHVEGDEHDESTETAEHNDAESDHETAPVLFSEDDHTDEGVHAEGDSNDAFRIFGVDAELNLWRLNVRWAFLLGQHDNPLGGNNQINYQGVMGNVTYPIRPNLLAAVRYDRVFSSDMESLEQQFLTPYLHLLLLENVHLGTEYNINLDDTDASNVSFMLDLAF